MREEMLIPSLKGGGQLLATALEEGYSSAHQEYTWSAAYTGRVELRRALLVLTVFLGALVVACCRLPLMDRTESRVAGVAERTVANNNRDFRPLCREDHISVGKWQFLACRFNTDAL